MPATPVPAARRPGPPRTHGMPGCGAASGIAAVGRVGRARVDAAGERTAPGARCRAVVAPGGLRG